MLICNGNIRPEEQSTETLVTDFWEEIEEVRGRQMDIKDIHALYAFYKSQYGKLDPDDFLYKVRDDEVQMQSTRKIDSTKSNVLQKVFSLITKATRKFDKIK